MGAITGGAGVAGSFSINTIVVETPVASMARITSGLAGFGVGIGVVTVAIVADIAPRLGAGGSGNAGIAVGVAIKILIPGRCGGDCGTCIITVGSRC